MFRINKKKKEKIKNINDLIITSAGKCQKMKSFYLEDFVPEYAPKKSEIIYYPTPENRIRVQIMYFIDTIIFTLPLERDEQGWFIMHQNTRLKCIPYENFEPQKITTKTRIVFREIEQKKFVIFIDDIECF